MVAAGNRPKPSPNHRAHRSAGSLQSALPDKHSQEKCADVVGYRMECTAIIVGAGPAGLACAASLKALGIDATVVEKDSSVGPLWRRHYDRLHLHTDRDHSGLPGLAMS